MRGMHALTCRARISPSLAIALLALFVALSGVGRAASSGSSNGVTVQYVTVKQGITIPANSSAGEYTPCPAGTRPIAGGDGTSANTGDFVVASEPYNSTTQTWDAPNPNAWAVMLDNTTSQPVSMTTNVVCANVALATPGTATGHALGSHVKTSH